MQTADKSPQNPDDYRALSPEQLLAVIAEKDTQLLHAEHRQASTDNKLRDTDNRLRDTESQVAEYKHYIRILEEYLRLAKAQKFGASSEKLSFQVDLFDEAELEVELHALENQLPDTDLLNRAKATRKRGFPAALNRVRIELTLGDDEKTGARSTFFTKVKEELEFIPAKLNVLEYWQEKAAFTADDDGEVSRSCMADWIVRLETVFKPLIHLIRAVQNSSDYLQADETRLQVRNMEFPPLLYI
tara:strand:+ start:946 stop:1677 length:732 start_codon:yes stop_codon:yes gene_type:complete